MNGERQDSYTLYPHLGTKSHEKEGRGDRGRHGDPQGGERILRSRDLLELGLRSPLWGATEADGESLIPVLFPARGEGTDDDDDLLLLLN